MENPGNNDEQSANTQHTVSEKIRDYILKHPWLVLWNASLLFGGFIFWVYFFQIGYFPDLTGDESIILFPLVAITVVSSILLMATILMAPCLFRWLILKPERIVLPELIKLPEKVIKKIKNNEKKIDSELLWYFISIFLSYAVLFFLEDYFWILAFLLFILQVVIYVFWQPFNKGQKGSIVVVAWVVSSIFSIFTLHFIEKSIDQIEAGNSYEKPFLLLATSLFVLSVNYGFSYEQEKNTQDRWWWLAIPLLPVLVILVIMRDPVFPKMVFKNFQFGNFTATRLLVNEEGCEIIEGMGLTCEPVTKEKQCVKVKNQCYLDKIKILSRFGSDIMLEIEPKNGKTNFTSKFKIPKKNVLSWLTVEHKNQIINKNDDSTQAASDAK